MMNKKFFPLVLLIIILFLTGCSTLVGIRTLIPSQVDLTGYKTIAVKSVNAYDYGWSYRSTAYPEIMYDKKTIPTPTALTRALNAMNWTIPYEDTASYLTGVVEDALDQGIYTIIDSTITDRVVRKTAQSYTVRQALLDMDVDALVTGKVTEQTYKTYITATVKTDPVTHKNTYNYYLHRNGTLRYEYVVQDVETLAIIDTYSFSENSTFYEMDSILIGTLNPDGIFVFSDSFVYNATDFVQKFRSMASSFGSTIKKRLTPYYTKSNLSLVSNKTKDESLKIAYDYVDNGMYYDACSIFEEHWNLYSDYVSGYNTAILYYATGRQVQGIELANAVYKATGEKNALNLYKKLSGMYIKNQTAISQITGEKGTSSSSKEVIL